MPQSLRAQVPAKAGALTGRQRLELRGCKLDTATVNYPVTAGWRKQSNRVRLGLGRLACAVLRQPK